MDQTSSKIEELKAIVEYAKANKLIKAKVGDIEVELTLASFQEKMNEDDAPTQSELESSIKHKLEQEREEILYFSAR